MAAINLSMAVEIDTTQLDELNNKLEESNKKFLEKVEKVCTVIPKMVEKLNYNLLQMMSKVAIYFNKLMEYIKIRFDQLFIKINDLRENIESIKVNLLELQNSINFSTWIQGSITAVGVIIAIGTALITAKSSAAALFTTIKSYLVPAFAALQATIVPLLPLLAAGAAAIALAIYCSKKLKQLSSEYNKEMIAIYNQGETTWKRNTEILGKIAKEAGTNAGQLVATYGTVDAALAACRRSTVNLGEAYRKVVVEEQKRAHNILPDMTNQQNKVAQGAVELSKEISSLVNGELKLISTTGKVTNEIKELKEECDTALPSLKKFIAEGKLGDLAHLDTSKKLEAFLAPSAELDDYALDMPVRGGILNPKKLLPSMKDWANSLMEMFSGISSSIQATFDRLRGGFDDIFKGFQAGAAKGGILGGITGALGPIGSIVGLIGNIPEILKQLWSSVKDFAKSIASLFGWMSEEEKVQKDVLRDLGATISDELAKKIADSSKEIGDRFTAVTLHLGDIMRETDITAKNFDTFASRARDVFSLLETGMIDATQATSTLNDVFPQLAEEADKLGISFNKNMIDMIQLSRTFGLEVQSIKQYVDEKLGIAVQGLTTATQNLGEIGQAEFDRLARAASATFQELMRNGSDIASAIDQMKTVIGNLGKAQEEYGLKGSAAFNQLKRYGNLVETNRSVIESVKGMTDVYTSLAQVGAMNQQLFNDWQTDTLSNYDKLIAGGFKQNEALALMAPTLQSLKEAHETMGYKIDDNTRALMEQADAAGLLKPDPMIEMRDAVIEMKDAVYDLIDHISGHSPPCGSLIESFDIALEYTKSYGRELINAFSPLPVETLISKMGEIPRDIGIHVGYTYDEYAGPYGGSYGGGTGPGGKYYAAQHGGIFTVPTHLLVGENPAYNPEVVLNRFQLERLLHQSPTSARNLNEGGGSAPTIINVYVAGEKVESVILPMLKQASRDGKMKIDSRAIED
jgi:polyhydroxyalkanoate synthesis regulator phasin